MIAIAIACKPRLLLADEPTTALDVTIQDQILALLAELQGEFGMAMILVSHDLGVVAENCDSVAVMYAGHVVEDAPADDALPLAAPPLHGALARRRCPSIVAPAVRGRLAQISGQPPDLARLPDGCPFRPRCPSSRDACAAVTMELELGGPRATRPRARSPRRRRDPGEPAARGDGHGEALRSAPLVPEPAEREPSRPGSPRSTACRSRCAERDARDRRRVRQRQDDARPLPDTPRSSPTRASIVFDGADMSAARGEGAAAACGAGSRSSSRIRSPRSTRG